MVNRAPATKIMVGIAKDGRNWHERFEHGARDLDIPYEIFDIGVSDWMSQVNKYACVVWRPNTDPPWLEHGLEKIHFMETELGIRCFPNWRTLSYYDNKRSQSYFFKLHNVPTPNTFVSYCPDECESFLRQCTYPIVSKTAGGSGSRGVKLIKDSRSARAEVRRVFSRSVAQRTAERIGRRYPQRMDTPTGYVYWQEFIPDNERDCRVTILGRKYGFVLYRRNRPGDFRASGSGLLEYEGPVGEREVAFLIELCRKNEFDSMAFDLLFRSGEFLVSEMSYTFPIAFLDEVPGYYEYQEDGACVLRNNVVNAQSLYMGYVAEWIGRRQTSSMADGR